MADAEKIVAVRIGGRVQGVGFRAFVQREAERRGVSGWVRNHRSGDVEALLAGTREAVAALCDACRRGPDAAHVSHFALQQPDPGGLGDLPVDVFLILPTAEF